MLLWWLRALRTRPLFVKPPLRPYCEDWHIGTGTIRGPHNIFADREAAMENKYFREKTHEDLLRLKAELRKRRRRKIEEQIKNHDVEHQHNEGGKSAKDQHHAEGSKSAKDQHHAEGSKSGKDQHHVHDDHHDKGSKGGNDKK